MRVLHVIADLSLGGSQNLLLNLVRRLDTTGAVENRICVLRRATDVWAGYDLPQPPTFLDLAADYRRPDTLAAGVVRLRELIGGGRCDVIHSYLWTADLLAALAVLGTRARHLSHVLDRRTWLASSRLRHRLRRAVTRQVLRRARTRFAAVSEQAAVYARQQLALPARHVAVVHNSIDPRAFAPTVRPAGPVVFGTLCRLVREKGVDRLLEAFARVAETSTCQLVIAGTGPLAGSLAHEAEALGLGDRVRLLGRVERSDELYRQIDVFVVPSVHSEGLPTTILEAMACGLPVVATDIGGAREAVRDGHEGRIVAPADPAALAAALAQLAGDPQARRRLGLSARERVARHFALDGMAAGVLDCYRRLRQGWR